MTGIIDVVLYLIDLVKPFLIGIILALVLNVPMSAIERLLKKKTSMKKGIRALSIVLALVLIVTILILVGSVVTFVVALVFSIYILASKEKLKSQACRLVRVWLPEKVGEPLIHVCAVCSSTFQSFIGGQITEAIIPIVGGDLGGPIGMLLGVPATSTAYSLLKEANGRSVSSK